VIRAWFTEKHLPHPSDKVTVAEFGCATDTKIGTDGICDAFLTSTNNMTVTFTTDSWNLARFQIEYEAVEPGTGESIIGM
jgi:hypothetical protein